MKDRFIDLFGRQDAEGSDNELTELNCDVIIEVIILAALRS